MDENAQGAPDPSEPDFVRLPRRRSPRPALTLQRGIHGSKPGAPFLRRVRTRDQTLREQGEGLYEATEASLKPASMVGRLISTTRRVLIGPPLATAALPHQRLSKIKALAVYSSDNLSSSAYATEEILIILVVAGTGALVYSLPITVALVALTALVVTSYRQTIRAYPNGGGAYIVASSNLGQRAGLLGGAALLVDYVMTVAVSIAAGVAAVTSALPDLYEYKVPLSIFFVALLTTANLRGIRESGTIFAIPTYFFILSFAAMIAVGLTRIALGDDLHAEPPEHALEAGAAAVTPFLLLRAFSSGAAALTGIEAVANGVPNFKPPEWRNAITIQAWMVVILSAFFLGTTVLAREMHVLPSETQTVVSQIARTVFGGGIPFYVIQASTGLILVLAANTAFADLPVLSSVMARDRVMPRHFLFRGDRLVFSNGIFVLGLCACIILVLFGAETTKIIPLYAFGVFLAFTLSQYGMVVHWRRLRAPGWRRAVVLSALGGTVTLVVTAIVGATKFEHGAWLSMSAIALLVVLLGLIRRHYDATERALAVATSTSEAAALASPAPFAPLRVLLLVEDVDRVSLQAAAYARGLSADVWAVHIALDREAGEELRQRWKQFAPDIPITIVEAPYRSLMHAIDAYVDSFRLDDPDRSLTVVLGEVNTRNPWHRLLHGGSGSRLRRSLQRRPGIVLVRVPFD
ncbi:MAG TPA: APC family permease [Dehalococcoidia bacterium]|nr:APC family permease [Dehalococcoidia bacterium]